MHRFLVLILAATFLLVFGQNCSSPEFSGKRAKSSKPIGGQQCGDSYSGKPYHFRLPTGLCEDGTDISATVWVEDEQLFLLTRDECRELDRAQLLAAETVQYDAASGSLVYDGRIFEVDESFDPDASSGTDEPPRATGALCDYPEFPLPIPDGGECSVENLVVTGGEPLPAERTNSGIAYAFTMYNVSSWTHGTEQLAAQGLPGERYKATQTVLVGSDHSPGSVDLILTAHEPTDWIIRGNVEAVRSVHVRGQHCASVTGVPENLVAISTDEQGSTSNLLALPLSANVRPTTVYEPACLPDRAFLAE